MRQPTFRWPASSTVPATSRPGLAVLAAAGGLALLSAACTISIDTTADTVSQTIDVADFDKIELGSAFDATIVVGDETGVEVEVNRELIDLLEIESTDGRLDVGLSGGLIATSGPMRITITTPELSALTVTGAAQVDVSNIDATDFELKVDGASDVNANGAIDTLNLEASGAANVDLDGATVTSAEVTVDGASNVSLTDVTSVSGSVSGASSLDVPDDRTFDVSTSGASTVD